LHNCIAYITVFGTSEVRNLRKNVLSLVAMSRNSSVQDGVDSRRSACVFNERIWSVSQDWSVFMKILWFCIIC